MVIRFAIVAAGTPLDMDVVNVYAAGDDDSLQSLRSFWDGTRQGPKR